MSHEPKRWDDSGMAKAMKFWPLFMAGITFVFAVGVASNTVNALDKRVTETEQINDRQEKQIAALEEVVKEMPEMKRDIKEILRRLR